jgi:hypothetical protein
VGRLGNQKGRDPIGQGTVVIRRGLPVTQTGHDVVQQGVINDVKCHGRKTSTDPLMPTPLSLIGQGSEELLDRGTVLVVHVLAEIADDTVLSDDRSSRVRNLRVRTVHQAPPFDRLQVRVGEEAEFDTFFRCVTRESIHRVGADRPDFGTKFLESAQTLLQLTELTTAEWSPQATIEDQYFGAVDRGQGTAASIGSGQLQRRSS